MGLVRLVTVLFLTVFAAGCATSGAVPRPFPGAPAGEPSPLEPDATRLDTAAIVETALSFRGVPYRTGGSDPAGFDCSGLVQYVFAQHGTALPRETREQFQLGADVRLPAIEAGDLIFFRTGANGPSHVGIAIGGDEFVHAPSTRGVVRVERFSAPYWASRIVGVRRVTR
jgi:cell wall-associated NlpC family hydrolase